VGVLKRMSEKREIEYSSVKGDMKSHRRRALPLKKKGPHKEEGGKRRMREGGERGGGDKGGWLLFQLNKGVQDEMTD